MYLSLGYSRINLKPVDLQNMRFAVVSHDAGAANQIVAMLQAHSFFSVTGVFKGPAQEIFATGFPGNVMPVTLSETIDRFDVLLCGSSGRATLERDAIRFATANSVSSVALVDATSNVSTRFSRGSGLFDWPSEIWSPYPEVYQYAQEAGYASSFSAIENFYLVREVEETRTRILDAKRRINQRPIRALFLGEFFPPEQGDIVLWALDSFLESDYGLSAKQVVFRPHPGGPKSQPLAASQRSGVVVSACPSLAEDLANSDLVVGCNSFAMLVALGAGIPTLSVLPRSFDGQTIDHPALMRLGLHEGSD